MLHSTDVHAVLGEPDSTPPAPPERRTRRAAFALLAAGLAAALGGCRTVVRPPSALNFDFDRGEDRVGGGGV